MKLLILGLLLLQSYSLASKALSDKEFDALFENKITTARVIVSEERVYPILLAPEIYPLSISTFLRLNGSGGFDLSYHTANLDIPYISKYTENFKSFNPHISVGLGYDTTSGVSNYLSYDLIFYATKSLWFGAKIVAEIDNYTELKPNAYTYSYIGYYVDKKFLLDTEQTLVYAGLYMGRMDVENIDVIYLQSVMTDIVKDGNYIFGLYYSPNKYTGDFAVSIESNSKDLLIFTILLGL